MIGTLSVTTSSGSVSGIPVYSFQMEHDESGFPPVPLFTITQAVDGSTHLIEEALGAGPLGASIDFTLTVDLASSGHFGETGAQVVIDAEGVTVHAVRAREHKPNSTLLWLPRIDVTFQGTGQTGAEISLTYTDSSGGNAEASYDEFGGTGAFWGDAPGFQVSPLAYQAQSVTQAGVLPGFAYAAEAEYWSEPGVGRHIEVVKPVNADTLAMLQWSSIVPLQASVAVEFMISTFVSQAPTYATWLRYDFDIADVVAWRIETVEDRVQEVITFKNASPFGVPGVVPSGMVTVDGDSSTW